MWLAWGDHGSNKPKVIGWIPPEVSRFVSLSFTFYVRTVDNKYSCPPAPTLPPPRIQTLCTYYYTLLGGVTLIPITLEAENILLGWYYTFQQWEYCTPHTNIFMPNTVSKSGHKIKHCMLSILVYLIV